MTEINLIISGQKLRIKNPELLPTFIRDSKRYIQLKLNFLSDDWNVDYITKNITYLSGEENHTETITEDTIIIPDYYAAKEYVDISIVGIVGDERITTNKIRVLFGESGYLEGETPPTPTTDTYTYLVNIVTEIQSKVDNGEFNGKDGKDGENYFLTEDDKQEVIDTIRSEIDFDSKVDKLEGKELSSNDFSNEYKTKLDNLTNYDDSEIKNSINNIVISKVEKVEGKQLSTNDYTNADKGKLANLENYDDTEINTKINNKVDKVEGKSLSTNDYTTEEKNKLLSLTNYDDTEIRGLINSKASKDIIVNDETEATNDTQMVIDNDSSEAVSIYTQSEVDELLPKVVRLI